MAAVSVQRSGALAKAGKARPVDPVLNFRAHRGPLGEIADHLGAQILAPLGTQLGFAFTHVVELEIFADQRRHRVRIVLVEGRKQALGGGQGAGFGCGRATCDQRTQQRHPDMS